MYLIHSAAKVACMSLVVIFSVAVMGIDTASAHCKGKHANYEPHCGGGSEPPSDGGDLTDPQVAYRDGGIYLANPDGTGSTLIWSGGFGPKLDAINGRVLFVDRPSTGPYDYMRLITYEFDSDQNFQTISETDLVSDGDLGGVLSSEGVSDWSHDGSKYSYSYRTQAITDGPWVHHMVVAPDPVEFPDGLHTEIYVSEDNGGLNSATWDASGNFIYHQDNPLDGSVPNGLFVIDVSSQPGRTVRALSLSSIMEDHGFAPESNVQSMSASFATGADPNNDGPTGAYRFADGEPANSDTSLCLMLSVIDWSGRRGGGGSFTIILDLPQIFDPTGATGGLHCTSATNGVPILNFQGSDFTTDDAEIVGSDTGSKGKSGGISIYDLGDGSRTKIISDGGNSDWSN